MDFLTIASKGNSDGWFFLEPLRLARSRAGTCDAMSE